MKPPQARVWLDDLLADLEPSSADLDRLVAECGKEGQHHDYKAGAHLRETRAADDIRFHVAGFANSDGGFLIVGYDEKRGLFDGCSTAPGGSSLHDWATRVLSSLSHYFSVQPRIRTAVHSGASSEILVISTERASGLVPVVHKGRLVFPLRIGDSTVTPPDYLITDLVLGRRNRPALSVKVSAARFSREPENINAFVHRLRFSMHVESESLVFAESVRVGLVGWSLFDVGVFGVPPSLSLRVDAHPPKLPGFTEHWNLMHVIAKAHQPDSTRPLMDIHLGPFERSADLPLSLAVPIPSDPTRVELGAGLYVLAQNAEPVWYQLTIRYSKREAFDSKGQMFLPSLPCSVERTRDRPKAYCEVFI